MDRRCCCQAGCEVFVDLFNRDNNENPGPDWVVLSGDWDILSWELVVDGAGKIRTVAGITNTTRRYVWVTCKDAQPGKVYGLIPCFNPDYPDNFIWVELACEADGVCILSLKQNPSTGTGTASALDYHQLNYTAGNDYTLIACVSEEGTYGTLGEMSMGVWDCAVTVGDKAAIYNIGAAAEYDNFHFYRHALDIAPTVDPNCPTCPCECEGHCMPRTLTLTLVSTCDHRNGETVTLTFNETAYPIFKWEGSAYLEYPLSPGISSLCTFTLYCGESSDCSGNQWKLCTTGYLEGQCSDDNYPYGCGETAKGDCSADVQCDPLQITFGQYTCTGSGPPDPPPSCTEYLIITE